jgi:hypothetical protein
VGATATDEKCVEYVRAALGDPDIPVEIEDVQRWNAAAEWAERFQAGRVLLTGDAAHVMPPTGGYGGNVGVQDGHNLAWKLAYVLDGRAGTRLLDTYEAERLPAARLIVEQAYTRYVTRLDPELGTEGLHQVVDDSLIDLGYRYRSESLMPDGPDDSADWTDPHASSGQPGFRAPHVPVRHGGREMSTLDLVKCNPVVLAGPNGTAWEDASRAVAERLGVPVDVHRIGNGGDTQDQDGRFAKAYDIEPDGAVLIRPDGFVAWRSRRAVDAPAESLGRALARTLCRTWP